MEIGVVVRGDRGWVIVAMSKTRLGTFEPTTREVFTSFHVVCLCRDLGIQHLFLGSDVKLIVDAVNSNSSTWGRFNHIVEDCVSYFTYIPKVEIWICPM
jgi:hypothetical protein